MLSVVRVFKLPLHVEVVAGRNIFLLGPVGHGVLLGRLIANCHLRRSGLGRDLHARLLFKSAGLERDAIRNRIDGMRFLIFSQFFSALLAAGAFARGLRRFLLGVGISARFAAFIAFGRGRLLRIGRLRRALPIRPLLASPIVGLLVRRIRHHVFQ